MQVVAEDLYLCVDCMYFAETGDATHFDGAYEEPEASLRLERVEASLRRLGPHLVADYDLDERWYECCDCYERCRESEIKKFLDTEYKEWIQVCPHCGEHDTLTERDCGYEEFSRRECDCCGSRLAGERYRFAILGEE